MIIVSQLHVGIVVCLSLFIGDLFIIFVKTKHWTKKGENKRTQVTRIVSRFLLARSRANPNGAHLKMFKIEIING